MLKPKRILWPTDSSAGVRETLVPPEPTATGTQQTDPRHVGRARTFAELLAAYRLVYECYVERGYVAPSDEQVRIAFHNLLPDTATFVLSHREIVDDGRKSCKREHNRRLFGTVSVVIDSSEYGLPLAETFPEQLRGFRRQGRPVAEAIMLAHRPHGSRRSVSAESQQLLMLLRCVTDYARLCNVRDPVIQTNPHHVEFYKRKLAFEVVDGPRPCPSVRGAPAVLMHRDMDTIRERCEKLVPKASRFFLSGDPDPTIRDGGYRLLGHDLIRLLSLKPGLWRTVSRSHSACDGFIQVYPDLRTVPAASLSRVVRLASTQAGETAPPVHEGVSQRESSPSTACPESST